MVTAKEPKSKRNRNKKKAPSELTWGELWILKFLYPNDSIGWARIYNSDVDAMFKYGYLTWKFKDERGEYYSTVQLTDDGRERYIKEMERANATEGAD